MGLSAFQQQLQITHDRIIGHSTPRGSEISSQNGEDLRELDFPPGSLIALELHRNTTVREIRHTLGNFDYMRYQNPDLIDLPVGTLNYGDGIIYEG